MTTDNHASKHLSLEQMHGYLNHSLSADEERMIDEHLADCDICLGALEELDLVQQADPEALEAHQHLTEAFAENLEKQQPAEQSRGGLGWLKYAAVIAVLLIPAYLLWPDGDNAAAGKALFAENFEPYEDVVSVRSGEGQPMAKAMEFYNEEDYPAASQAFETLLQQNASNEPALFYLGVSLLASGDDATAVQKLSQVLENANSPFKESAEWFLLLAHLAGDNTAEATRLSEQLAKEPGHAYGAKAEVIFNELQVSPFLH